MTWLNSLSRWLVCWLPCSLRSGIASLIQRSSLLGLAATVTVLGSTLTGCDKTNKTFPTAGDPLMVLEGQGRVRMAGYDEATNQFHDLGWYDAAGLANKTVVDYDWSK